jgi:hypothetical protein
MSTKKHIRELLSVYLDQMCSDEEKKIVETHLAECTDCRQELEDLRKTVTLVAGLKEIEPPENLWEGIEQRIQKKSFWEVFAWRPVPVAVATVTILLLAVTVNKYSSRIAEQSKPGTKQDLALGGNVPLVPPFLPLKQVQSVEKKVTAKAEAKPAPSADAMRYNEEMAGKEMESGYANAPQERSGLTAVSQVKGQLLDKDTRISSTYVIEMEVEDRESARQRLQALADNYQARRVDQFGDDRDLLYHVQQQQLPAFIREVNKLSRDSRRKIATDSLWEAPASTIIGSGGSVEPQLIRIRFNPPK